MLTSLGAAVVLRAEGRDILPRIGPAPGFTLTTQDGARLSLGDLRGKVVAMTFIYASCADTCPILTAKMATVQARLGANFGPRVFFASITVDPERDTPEALKHYAQGHGADLRGWAFLTGTASEIRQARRTASLRVIPPSSHSSSYMGSGWWRMSGLKTGSRRRAALPAAP